MSSSDGPGIGACKLYLGNNFVRLERPGFPDDNRVCTAGEAEYRASLRDFSLLSGGPVTAVLPPEVFAVAEAGRGRLARRRARRALARTLGVERSALVAATGRAGGALRLVGLPAETMEATVSFLDGLRIRVVAVEPAPELLPGGHVPRFRVRERGGPLFAGAVWSKLRRMAATRRVWAATGMASAAVLMLLFAGLDGKSEGTEPIPPQLYAQVDGSGSEAPADTVEAKAAVVPPSVHAAVPSLRAARPLDRPHLAPLRTDAPQKRLPAALPAATEQGKVVAVASRSVPPEVREAALAAAAREEAARLEPGSKVAVLGPLPRPERLGPEPPEQSIRAVIKDGRPLPRPGWTRAGAAVAPAPEGAALSRADGRPLPRPTAQADRLSRAVEAAIAAAVPAEPAAGRGQRDGALAGGIRPEPRSFVAGARPEPSAAAAAPVQPVMQSVAAAGPRTGAVLPMAARAAPAGAAPGVQVRPAPQAPPVQTVSRGSGTLSLIGVFGTSSRRHALVRLPNGSIQRVRPGDAVNGVQIAAVGAESVRVRVNGREGVLSLPD